MSAGRNLPRASDVLLDKYRIEEELGRGGMGVVYAAHHEFLNQRVALKLLLDVDHSPESTARFLNEARLAGRLRSEHACRVMDAGALPDGTLYIVMEYLAGRDLAQVLHQRGALSVIDAVDYLLQALHAVAEAHGAGIVHRDLKPSNLFLTEHPGRPSFVKVLDFGISKATEVGGEGVTTTGTVMGSPAYMAPEQIRNTKTVDQRADVWALGVILYQFLVGSCPFPGTTMGAVLANIFERRPDPIRDARPDVPAALEAVVFKCLSRHRSDRFATVADLAEALLPFASNERRSTIGRIRATLAQSPSSPELVTGAVKRDTDPHAPTERVEEQASAPASTAPKRELAPTVAHVPPSMLESTTAQGQAADAHPTPSRTTTSRTRMALVVGGALAFGALGVISVIRMGASRGPERLPLAASTASASVAAAGPAPVSVPTLVTVGVDAAAPEERPASTVTAGGPRRGTPAKPAIVAASAGSASLVPPPPTGKKQLLQDRE